MRKSRFVVPKKDAVSTQNGGKMTHAKEGNEVDEEKRGRNATGGNFDEYEM